MASSRVLAAVARGRMLTGIGLRKWGITSFRIVEKAADFGGTWYWNC